ncbi:Arp6 protein [Martiniozyma asiatica (nom. inval.)]|nr:Arp6 protein [Martiniozyma asiatica]
MDNIIIDNGQYTLKYGYAHLKPKHVPNCVIRTSDRQFHLGSSLSTADSMSKLPTLSGLTFHRPINQGQCYQWNLEHQIWDNAFVNNGDDSGNGDFLIGKNLLYLESPVTLSKFQNMTDQILFEEYGISSLVRSSGASMVPWMDEVEENSNDNNDTDSIDNKEENDNKGYKPFQLVIDAGFDATWVVPLVYGIPYYKAIRKMPIGGRLLNGYLREVISFRHYNVVEEPVLVDAIKCQTCYVAQNYDESIKRLTKLRQNNSALLDSDMSLEYLLPDQKNDYLGKPLKGKLPADGQSILLTDERFLIPELLFHPQIAGIQKAGIIETLKDSLSAVPELLRPLLANNVTCIGGTANLKGFSGRIARELDSEVPVEAKVRLCEYEMKDKTNFGWYSGRAFFEKGGYDTVKLTKEEYQEFGCEYSQEKFGFKKISV